MFMQKIVTLTAVLSAMAMAQDLIPGECLRKGEVAGTVGGTPFTDADLIVTNSTVNSALFAFSYCMNNNILIGLRAYTQDEQDNTLKNKLNAHGITDRPNTCTSSVLPSFDLKYVRVYTIKPTGSTSDIVVGFGVAVADKTSGQDQIVVYGIQSQTYVETATAAGSHVVGFYGTTGASGITSLGPIIYSKECTPLPEGDPSKVEIPKKDWE